MALNGDALKVLALELSAAMPPVVGMQHTPFMDRAHLDEILFEDPPVGLVLDQSPTARLARKVMRHVRWYWWGKDEVSAVLDRYGAMTLEELNAHALQQILERLEHLELCAQTGCDPDDAVPAR